MSLKSFVQKEMSKIRRQKRTRFDMFLSFGCLILSLAILLSTVTYAWIRRSWSSTIRESQLKIESNGSLAFQLDSENSTYTNAISLLSQIGDKDFTLKPVSNLTGLSSDFFYLNKDVANNETYKHIPMASTPKDRLETGKQYGYVEFYFKILGEQTAQGEEDNSTKFVYLESSSYFTAYDEGSANAPRALRISITAKSNTGLETTTLFKMDDPITHLTHTGINNTVENGEYIADNAQYWQPGNVSTAQYITKNDVATNDSVVLTTTAHELSEYNGGIQTDATTGKRYITQNACLCSFSSTEAEDMVVRIWIEGTDPACDDTIAGNKISLLLSFGAVKCEYDSTDSRYYIIEHTVDNPSDTGS